jgi:pimeloyl-ACP methyl ester carboxylesterase
MNVFARAGYDVWTMDHENYGRSSQTAGNSDIASGVEDLKAATGLVLRETGRSAMHMLGVSSGAIRAGAFAQAQPTVVERLVLVAFTYRDMGSPALKKRAEKLDYFRTHNRRLRDREMIRSIFARDGHPEFYDPAVAEALADAELVYGDQIPTGTYLDMTLNLPLVDPAKVKSPVLLLSGEHDGNATLDDLYDFFKALPNGDRQLVILPRVSHSVTYSRNRHLFWHAVTQFLEAPAPTV